MYLSGVRSVVVGGASGMARATAEEIVRRGGSVAIVDLPNSEGRSVAEALGATFHELDVLDFDSAEAVMGEAATALGGINVLLNTAGGGMPARTVNRDGPMPLDHFRKIIDLNLVGTFNLSRLAAWYMSKNDPTDDGERGVIINTASIAAFEGQIGQVAYTAAKAGIAGMCLTMARDLGSLGIRVNAIAPSLFKTGITAGVQEQGGTTRLTQDAAFPKRMGRPEEFARVALTIIETPMLNGGTIRLDAGQRFGPR